MKEGGFSGFGVRHDAFPVRFILLSYDHCHVDRHLKVEVILSGGEIDAMGGGTLWVQWLRCR